MSSFLRKGSAATVSFNSALPSHSKPKPYLLKKRKLRAHDDGKPPARPSHSALTPPLLAKAKEIFDPIESDPTKGALSMIVLYVEDNFRTRVLDMSSQTGLPEEQVIDLILSQLDAENPSSEKDEETQVKTAALRKAAAEYREELQKSEASQQEVVQESEFQSGDKKISEFDKRFTNKADSEGSLDSVPLANGNDDAAVSQDAPKEDELDFEKLVREMSAETGIPEKVLIENVLNQLDVVSNGIVDGPESRLEKEAQVKMDNLKRAAYKYREALQNQGNASAPVDLTPASKDSSMPTTMNDADKPSQTYETSSTSETGVAIAGTPPKASDSPASHPETLINDGERTPQPLTEEEEQFLNLKKTVRDSSVQSGLPELDVLEMVMKELAGSFSQSTGEEQAKLFILRNAASRYREELKQSKATETDTIVAEDPAASVEKNSKLKELLEKSQNTPAEEISASIDGSEGIEMSSTALDFNKNAKGVESFGPSSSTNGKEEDQLPSSTSLPDAGEDAPPSSVLSPHSDAAGVVGGDELSIDTLSTASSLPEEAQLPILPAQDAQLSTLPVEDTQPSTSPIASSLSGAEEKGPSSGPETTVEERSHTSLRQLSPEEEEQYIALKGMVQRTSLQSGLSDIEVLQMVMQELTPAEPPSTANALMEVAILTKVAVLYQEELLGTVPNTEHTEDDRSTSIQGVIVDDNKKPNAPTEAHNVDPELSGQELEEYNNLKKMVQETSAIAGLGEDEVLAMVVDEMGAKVPTDSDSKLELLSLRKAADRYQYELQQQKSPNPTNKEALTESEGPSLPTSQQAETTATVKEVDSEAPTPSTPISELPTNTSPGLPLTPPGPPAYEEDEEILSKEEVEFRETVHLLSQNTGEKEEVILANMLEELDNLAVQSAQKSAWEEITELQRAASNYRKVLLDQRDKKQAPARKDTEIEASSAPPGPPTEAPARKDTEIEASSAPPGPPTETPARKDTEIEAPSAPPAPPSEDTSAPEAQDQITSAKLVAALGWLQGLFEAGTMPDNSIIQLHQHQQKLGFLTLAEKVDSPPSKVSEASEGVSDKTDNSMEEPKTTVQKVPGDPGQQNMILWLEQLVVAMRKKEAVIANKQKNDSALLTDNSDKGSLKEPRNDPQAIVSHVDAGKSNESMDSTDSEEPEKQLLEGLSTASAVLKKEHTLASISSDTGTSVVLDSDVLKNEDNPSRISSDARSEVALKSKDNTAKVTFDALLPPLHMAQNSISPEDRMRFSMSHKVRSVEEDNAEETSNEKMITNYEPQIQRPKISSQPQPALIDTSLFSRMKIWLGDMLGYNKKHVQNSVPVYHIDSSATVASLSAPIATLAGTLSDPSTKTKLWDNEALEKFKETVNTGGEPVYLSHPNPVPQEKSPENTAVAEVSKALQPSMKPVASFPAHEDSLTTFTRFKIWLALLLGVPQMQLELVSTNESTPEEEMNINNNYGLRQSALNEVNQTRIVFPSLVLGAVLGFLLVLVLQRHSSRFQPTEELTPFSGNELSRDGQPSLLWAQDDGCINYMSCATYCNPTDIAPV